MMSIAAGCDHANEVSENGKFRKAMEVEIYIADYCYDFDHHYNKSCAALGCANFESKPYDISDLHSAAVIIFEKLQEAVKNRFKPVHVHKADRYLIKALPAYIDSFEQTGKSDAKAGVSDD